MSRGLFAYLVHAYTATGVVWGFLALRAAIDGDVRTAMFWLALATLIDITDGALARLADTSRHAALIDGARLDDVVDYVTYVFVPVAIVWRTRLVPADALLPVAAAMLMASACGFARRDAKTPDHFFTGFPSYWNIVVLYLLVLGLAPAWAAAILLTLAGLVFVPFRWIYPSRTEALRRTTLALGTVWSVQVLAMIWFLPHPARPLGLSALAFPAYYVAASLWLATRIKSPRLARFESAVAAGSDPGLTAHASTPAPSRISPES